MDWDHWLFCLLYWRSCWTHWFHFGLRAPCLRLKEVVDWKRYLRPALGLLVSQSWLHLTAFGTCLSSVAVVLGPIFELLRGSSWPRRQFILSYGIVDLHKPSSRRTWAACRFWVESLSQSIQASSSSWSPWTLWLRAWWRLQWEVHSPSCSSSGPSWHWNIWDWVNHLQSRYFLCRVPFSFRWYTTSSCRRAGCEWIRSVWTGLQTLATDAVVGYFRRVRSFDLKYFYFCANFIF